MKLSEEYMGLFCCLLFKRYLFVYLFVLVGEGKGYPFQYSGLENSWGRKELDTTEQLSQLPSCSTQDL